jgi:transposase
MYVPYIFRQFQGFEVKDIKEYHSTRHMRLDLEASISRKRLCGHCGEVLGDNRGTYWREARHLKAFGWTVSIRFPTAKCECSKCKKIRSELIEFICPTSPHVTQELAWWLNRLSEATSVLAVSRLESIGKSVCYKVDKYILQRLLQGYTIPEVTEIAVDEVYARGPKQLKKGETRDDLFLTVIVDLRTGKVIWVSQSRRKEALDQFFEIIGTKNCQKIKVVATDQHEGYSASVAEHCPNAKVVWDRFHLVQNFNEALNEERKSELERIDPEGPMEDLMNGKYRYVFLTKAENRKEKDQRHISEVMRLNSRMAQLEMIKEHFHKLFECTDQVSAQAMLCECYEWAVQIKASSLVKWIWSILDDQRFWNYFTHKVTTGLSEGINRTIKTLKWQAYGYKDMHYFALKILQKVGYLNYRYFLSATN